jgi:hypothetical protein
MQTVTLTPAPAPGHGRFENLSVGETGVITAYSLNSSRVGTFVTRLDGDRFVVWGPRVPGPRGWLASRRICETADCRRLRPGETVVIRRTRG